MHVLNREIDRWRAAFERTGLCSRDEIEELASHFREEGEALVSLGLSEEEAFAVGRMRIGDPGELQAEYVAADRGWPWRRRLAWTGRYALAFVPAILCFALVAWKVYPVLEARTLELDDAHRLGAWGQACAEWFWGVHDFGLPIVALGLVVLGTTRKPSSRLHDWSATAFGVVVNGSIAVTLTLVAIVLAIMVR